MTFDPFASPFLHLRRGGPWRRPDLILGVFNYEGDWKVYSQHGTPDPYPSREEAMVAAEARASEAARAGRRVELFVEDEDGSLGQARIELAAQRP